MKPGATSTRGRLHMASNGAVRGGEARGDNDRKVVKVAHVEAAVRLMTVEYLENSGMELAALGVLGTAAGRGMVS